MLHKKQGFPEESELVMCTVTQVLHNSVFVNLDEYGKQGMIHISEVSPGRIRNIRDFVRIGKVVVCKVLRVNERKGYIDLSLRRVNDSQRRQKVNLVKQEQLAEKIIEHVAKQHDISVRDLYNKVGKVVFKDYDSLYYFFEDIVTENETIDTLGLKKDIEASLKEVVLQRIKPKVYELKAIVSLSTYNPEGVELVKKILTDAEKLGVNIYYKGGGMYYVETSSVEIKEAKDIMKKVEKHIIKKIDKIGEGSFEFIEDKK